MLKADNNVTVNQYRLALITIWVLILILLIRYFQIQILEHENYSNKSKSNRIRKVIKNAPRGLILDRNGEILVDNFPVYVLKVIPGEFLNKNNQFKLISKYVSIDSSALKKNYKKYYRGKFIPTQIAKDISFKQISYLEENKLNFQGIYYDQIPERSFPQNIRSPHLFGYVKEVDRKIRKDLVLKNSYELGDLIGWSGLEKQYETYLRGNSGISFYEVDAFGREVGTASEIQEKKADPGLNIQTTIDSRIQKSSEELMNQRKGVILIANSQSGQILAAVSSPDYQPSLFTGKTSVDEWAFIRDNKDKPLMNRYTRGAYPPGSIVKMITSAVLYENEYITSELEYDCNGSYQFGDRIFGCWNRQGHGMINISEAIAFSCDVYFYKAVRNLDFDELSVMFTDFGFGYKTNIDLPNERTGLVPSRKYMTKRYGKFGWSQGALLNMAIGQGELLATPVQILNYTNLLATKGESDVPHFVMATNLPNNVKPQLNDNTWSKIHTDMRSVIKHGKGTGRKANPGIDGMTIYGKTGTAENSHGGDHAWFIGWANYGDQKYTVIVLMENAGSGGSVAAPIAKALFKIIFENIPTESNV